MSSAKGKEDARETTPPIPINTEPPLSSLLFQSGHLPESIVSITPSPTRVAPVLLSEREGCRAQTPSFPNTFLHDLHRQIDALAAQIDAFREEREVLIRVVRADLRPGYRDPQRTVGSSKTQVPPCSSPVPGPGFEAVLSPFHGYGMPLRYGFVDVGVQTRPLDDPTTVRSRLLIPQRGCV